MRQTVQAVRKVHTAEMIKSTVGRYPDIEKKNRRILIVDDSVSIHNDIRAVLKTEPLNDEISELATALLDEPGTTGDTPRTDTGIEYEIDSAYQGAEGLQLVEQSLKDEQPYALAIVDMRMPPGWDGIETIERIRRVDPDLQIAICTAYSDYSWEDILKKFGQNDWLLIFKKPFDFAEVRQLACAVTEKWNLARQAALRMEDLERIVEQHARKLSETNAELTSQNKRLSKEIAARRRADERIRHIAYHDTLTDLPNRSLLLERLDSCIGRSRVQANYMFAVLFMDLDDFKIVNDSLGHRFGDELLCQIAQRLTKTIRSLDRAPNPSFDTVARLGGDEFIILLDDLSDPTDAVNIAERIQQNVCQPTLIEQKEMVPGISIGVAVSTGDYGEASDIVRDADTALYHAKGLGKGRVAVFDQAMRSRVTQRLDLGNALRHAIDLEQLSVEYQPVVSLKTGAITGFEALTRWQHPTHGAVPPSDFIPIAEETGLIVPLGQWLLEQVCRDLVEWRSQYPEHSKISVSVNLSVRQLMRREIVGEIRDALRENSLDSSALKLEITESIMMEESSTIQTVLSELEEAKMELHVDDFGTGYSSLSVLHTLPISAVKLDRAFVRELPDQVEFATTVQAMVMLARNRRVKLIAEGVETFEQLVQLQALDCDMAQGFYFSRPVSTTAVKNMLADGARFGVSKHDQRPQNDEADQQPPSEITGCCQDQ